jgi:hypothetical protein
MSKMQVSFVNEASGFQVSLVRFNEDHEKSQKFLWANICPLVSTDLKNPSINSVQKNSIY